MALRMKHIFKGYKAIVLFLQQTKKSYTFLDKSLVSAVCFLSVCKSQMIAATPAGDLLVDVHSLCNT